MEIRAERLRLILEHHSNFEKPQIDFVHPKAIHCPPNERPAGYIDISDRRSVLKEDITEANGYLGL